MYHYAGNNPVRYTDPDGKLDADTFYQFAYAASDKAQSVALADSPALGPCDAVALGILAAAAGAVVIGGCVDLYNNVLSKIEAGSAARAKENNNKEPTVIYRTGSGNGTNLTPRTPKDSTGLSYSLTKPACGPYTVTTMEAVNATGVLSAVRDGPDHVSVIPTDISKMPEWQATREHANENPHTYTKILQNISVKVSD